VAMPEARTIAADRVSREVDARSSFTQQFISQPKKLIGSWGMFSLKTRGRRYINGMKVISSRSGPFVFGVEANKARRKLAVE
jgi:hypothetical protein